MKCPFCGTVNQPGESFCSNCGGYLDGSDMQTVVGNSSPTIVSTTGSTSATTTGGGTGGARTLAPNARLQNGRYVVEKVLGQGGMGAAVLARDTRVSNKPVVIKELVSENTDPRQHQEDVHNFEREVETLATLDHPLIPTVTDSFQEGSHYFMVQEYAAGENLEDRMERVNQPMAEREALTYTSQVLDILDYLEQQTPPIVHRDIKPANIIIGAKDKRARLVDFGIARTESSKSAKRKQTSALGTPGYAPPEQYQGNADTRSDLYALAATLHHILTNRDPRNYPPFVYPPVRSLNAKLTPDIERVLERALKINVNERYQNAAAMKHDIDEILEKQFASSGDMSNYTLRTSTQAGIPPVAASASTFSRSAPPQAASSSASQQRMAPPLTAPPPQVGTYARQPKQRRAANPLVRNFALLVVVVLLIGFVLFALPRIIGSGSSSGPAKPIAPNGSTGSSSTNAGSANTSTNPISIRQVGNETIGMSDGSYALDTSRSDGDLKKQASDAFKNGDKGGAVSLWNQAVSQDTSDAESLIYLEDQRIAAYPHITVVVGTMPSGASSLVSVARDDLQGAYVLQKEYNDGSKLPGGLKVRLLIASSGGNQQNAASVAQQIVQLAQQDKTFAGVMGWPYSGLTYAVAPILAQAKIPMVSQTASGDDLSGISPYFFHVAPTNKAQGSAGAKYAESTLGAKNVAVFSDDSDLYSQSLAADFTQQFTADGGTTFKESYKIGQPNTMQNAIQQALQKKPDLIYFAGYSSDVNPLLSALSSANAPANLQVLGGDALYELGGYQGVSLSRLHFTAFAYPDEWGVQGLDSQKPAFFNEYANAFDPNHKHTGSPYGFTRPTSDAMLSYDATTALLKAVATATSSKTSFTLDDVKSALAHTAFQGVSGWITFDQNGDPINKALVILSVDPQGHIQMQKAVNKFTNS